ncbi:unnamed protein product [Plutella xylostella]|uniref:(diamondback moth) hypothetical protein n=1 Tax=Plutella xylostella TaxID=51655 RepID=A0A8S4DFG0_PLUXY|nr:unnamed protein product [Plutella xylostella]
MRLYSPRCLQHPPLGSAHGSTWFARVWPLRTQQLLGATSGEVMEACRPGITTTRKQVDRQFCKVQVQRHSRPASYAGGGGCGGGGEARREPRPGHSRDHDAHYASSSLLDETEGAAAASMDALKTRSLPAFLRPKPRPLSTEDDLQQLYAKVNLSKKYKNRMRSEHAAIIALSKSHSQFFDADAVIVYDQRTAL